MIDKAAIRPAVAFWRSSFSTGQGLLAVVTLALVFAAMRCAGMLGPAAWRPLLPAGFILMALCPWLLLSPAGRRDIGLRLHASWRAMFSAMLLGVLAALVCFATGLLWFGRSADNWYVSVAASYRGMMDTAPFSTLTLHLVFTLPAILFSPIGEEIFFRGIFQRALEQRFSTAASTRIECTAFGLVHLCHHGLVFGASGVGLRPWSAPLWVAAMCLVAYLFASIARRSVSLYPAIAAHAAFNATMNTVIFAFLWR